MSFVVGVAAHPVAFILAGTAQEVPFPAAVTGLLLISTGVFLIAGETPAAGKSFIHVRGGELGGGGKSDGGTSDGVITGS